MTKPVSIVNFSMGICSAYIAARLQLSCENPICLFNDTQAEDADTYRFGREVAEVFGLNVVEISDGRHLWELFVDENMIPARQIKMCSIKMKVKPSEKFFANWPAEIAGTVAYGYDMDEEERFERTVKNWKHAGLTPIAPLQDWGVTKSECFGFFLEHGIQPPRIYRHFQHGNCLPCKNFQRLDWIALRYHYPEAFDKAMAFEQSSGLTWQQDGTKLSEIPEFDAAPSRKGRHKLASHTPSFSTFEGCDACGVN